MLKKYILLTIGFGSLSAGFAGVYVPLLPTTPFVLLSLFCFSKSSDKFHTWLVSTNIYKKYVQEFQRTRSVPMRSKINIIIFLYLSVGISIYFIENMYIQLGLVAMLILQTLVFFLFVPTRKLDKKKKVGI
ncbi:YbaN family protein [Pontibacillus litoralis]|uniref:DUF454 domain-containing protein n=1 Tax=Pontibacillus litoralis JSM 072002 TaxID=1385512 RepID=A0A0A5G2H1_9BACI|nr:YbaN family protein [Pontibacillus litoralis]KGX86239.1 hypothetical protein N784_05735 [Pontibacillus litoralis JSM 072002]